MQPTAQAVDCKLVICEPRRVERGVTTWLPVELLFWAEAGASDSPKQASNSTANDVLLTRTSSLQEFQNSRIPGRAHARTWGSEGWN